MQLNVFAWIREKVKRSVLLGVSDAIEWIGTPARQIASQCEPRLAVGNETTSPQRKRGKRSTSLGFLR